MKKTIVVSNSKKLVTVLTVILFSVFTFSCQSISPQKVEAKTFPEGKIVKVYQLQKTTGERIYFHKKDPAIMSGGKIKFEIVDENGNKKPVEVSLSEVELVWVKKFNVGKSAALGLGGGALAYVVIIAVVAAGLTLGILGGLSKGSTDYH